MTADVASTLLPPSRVDFYVSDDGTAALVEKLKADWRFARVEIRMMHEGIDAATARYVQEASPELILLETDDISDAFINQLGGLAGVCAEGTDAVIIGPTNDVHLYRNLVGMGVRDYLVRPVGEDDMVAVIAQALVDKRGLSGARLVAVAGGKGGVGTTSIAQITAWSIAETLKQKTLLLDAAGSNSTLGVSYGLEPSASFSEAVRVGSSGSEDDLNRILQKATDNLTMLICGGDPVLGARPDPDIVEAMVTRLMQKYPVIVIDLSGASRAVQQRMIALAADVIMVTTPMLTALRNTRTYLGEIKAMRSGLEEVDLLVNMQGLAGGKEEVPIKDIEAALETDAAAKIAYTPKVFALSESTGKPVGASADAKDIMQQILPLAERGAAVKHAGGKDEPDTKEEGPLSFLKKLTQKEK